MTETDRDKKFCESIVSTCTDHIQPSERELNSLFNLLYTADSCVDNRPFYGKIYFDANGKICNPGVGYFLLDFKEYPMFYISINPRVVCTYKFHTEKFVNYINIISNNTPFTTSKKIIFLFGVRLTWILLTKWFSNEYIYTQEMRDIIISNSQFVKNIY